MQLFEQRLQEAQRPPTESTLFQAGQGALVDQLDEQEERDAQTATARGLTGSQFEIAQGGQRAEAAAQETRSLLVDAERAQEQQEQSALRGLLSPSQFEESRRARRQREEDRRRRFLGQLIGSALQAGTSIFAPSPQDASSNATRAGLGAEADGRIVTGQRGLLG